MTDPEEDELTMLPTARATLLTLFSTALAALVVSSGAPAAIPASCPSGSTYNPQPAYQYCVPNSPQSPNAHVAAIVKTAATAYAVAHHWNTSCSNGHFGFVCILYTPDTTGHGLTTPNNDVAHNGTATKALINGVSKVVFQHMAYTALGGSGCAITLYFGSTYPNTMDACGPSGLAHLRKTLADYASTFR